MRYAGLDDRFGVAWNAATLMVQGEVEDALELLESFDGPELDDWSRRVLAGCAHLRRAQEHVRLAERLERQSRSRDARREWMAASAAWQAADEPPLARRVETPLGLPDPWPHILELFREHVEERRRGGEQHRPAV
jgi:hypothetical protein